MADPVHARENSAAALLSVASNAALTIVKLGVGFVTGSVAVLSEAANSAGDLIASAIALAGVRAAARPADADHPYGHEKSENLAAAVEGVLVLAAGAAVAVEAIRRLASGAPAIDHIGLAVGVMAASAIVNLLVSLRLRRVARRTGSPAIEGDATHLAADVWTSAGAAVGLALVAVTGWEPLDAIVALAVAGYVAAVGARLVWRAADVLLDASLPDGDMRVIEDVLAGFRGEGMSFHAVRGRRAGSKRLIDLHMVVPPETTVRRGHAMSGRVKGAMIAALPGTEVLIHLEDHEPGTRNGRVLDRRGETIAP
jgi:cation diffusion facilitator family transporter